MNYAHLLLQLLTVLEPLSAIKGSHDATFEFLEEHRRFNQMMDSISNFYIFNLTESTESSLEIYSESQMELYRIMNSELEISNTLILESEEDATLEDPIEIIELIEVECEPSSDADRVPEPKFVTKDQNCEIKRSCRYVSVPILGIKCLCNNNIVCG